MFQKYPKTMQIPVYKGHRDFRYSDEVCAAIKKNATTAEMVTDGQGIKSLGGAISFPHSQEWPRGVLEHDARPRAYTEENVADSANVLSDGSVCPAVTSCAMAPPTTRLKSASRWAM